MLLFTIDSSTKEKGGEEMIKRLMDIMRDEEGATMVEYALMLALIAVVCIVAVTAVGTKARDTFKGIETGMP